MLFNNGLSKSLFLKLFPGDDVLKRNGRISSLKESKDCSAMKELKSVIWYIYIHNSHCMELACKTLITLKVM